MVLILICTIVGFLVGFTYVIIKRRIRPARFLTAGFLGLLAAAIWKILKDYSRRNKRFHLN